MDDEAHAAGRLAWALFVVALAVGAYAACAAVIEQDAGTFFGLHPEGDVEKAALFGFVLGSPGFLFGAAIGRWWALAFALSMLLLQVVPGETCGRPGFDEFECLYVDLPAAVFIAALQVLPLAVGVLVGKGLRGHDHRRTAALAAAGAWIGVAVTLGFAAAEPGHEDEPDRAGSSSAARLARDDRCLAGVDLAASGPGSSIPLRRMVLSLPAGTLYAGVDADDDVGRDARRLPAAVQRRFVRTVSGRTTVEHVPTDPPDETVVVARHRMRSTSLRAALECLQYEVKRRRAGALELRSRRFTLPAAALLRRGVVVLAPSLITARAVDRRLRELDPPTTSPVLSALAALPAPAAAVAQADRCTYATLFHRRGRSVVTTWLPAPGITLRPTRVVRPARDAGLVRYAAPPPNC